MIIHFMKVSTWDFPDGPVVKTLPSNAADTGSTPSLGAKIPHASQSKKQNIRQKQYCNNSIKTLKVAHIKEVLISISLKIQKSLQNLLLIVCQEVTP